MTSNYDVFFVFGKEKKLHQIIFLGELERLGIRCQVSDKTKIVAAHWNLNTETSMCAETCWRSRNAGKDPAILDLRMQILDWKAQ